VAGSAEGKYLLDVSRLVWRVWRGGLPTGIDRVCLAYLERFGDRSRAVVQWRGLQLVLSTGRSRRLFTLLATGGTRVRRRMAALLAGAVAGTYRQAVRAETIYLNVGHTGLNEPALGRWIRERRLRAIYLVHDLIPITHPQFCRRGEEGQHRARMTTVLATAAGVIGNSQATLNELARFAEESGASMPPSVAAWISGNPVVWTGDPARFERPHFVALGTIEGRKNHALLLEVWKQLVQAHDRTVPILFIVGRRGWQAEGVFAQLDGLGALHGHVRELGGCSDDELSALVAGARAVLMPSFAEGFGLPVIEALEGGTPVIASDLAVYHEIAGNVPTYLSPDNPAAWAETVQAFATDGPERQRQLAAIEGYRAPQWADHFTLVEHWLEGR